MKKIMTISSAMLPIISLPAYSPDFNRSRTGNDDQLVMEYTTFSITDSQDLVVEVGDTIHMEIVIENGHLSYKTQKNDDEPAVENESIFSSKEFDVEVKESGTHIVTATGEKVRGNIKPAVESAE